MHIFEKAEVHFHQQEQLSVYLESNSLEDLEKVGEVGLLTMFALRMLSNLGYCEAGDNLARILKGASEAVWSLATGHTTGGFELIPYPGFEGRKRFYATFQFQDDRVWCDVKSKGFGLFGTGLGYYATIAVVGVFRYLALKRQSDSDYLPRLAAAAVACGQTYLLRKLGLSNQAQLAGRFIVATCGELIWPESRGKTGPDPMTTSAPMQLKPVVPQPRVSSVSKSDQLPPTINPHDKEYEVLGREFNEHLGRSDGLDVARSLHAYSTQDLRDWLYGRVWPYFSRLPVDQWSQKDSALAEYNCHQVISFFQAIRGKATAADGFVPDERAEWFLNWLLRLNLGESTAQDAAAVWVSKFEEQGENGHSQLFAATLGRHLPELRGRSFLLLSLATTLEIRAHATTIRAFGDTHRAEGLHAEAVSREEGVDRSIETYSAGGLMCYVLELDQGVLTTVSEQYGTLFHLWTEQASTKEMNEGSYGGRHRVTTMSFRELKEQLLQMQSAGLRYVTLDRRLNGEGSVLPIATMLQHVQETIDAVNSSELGIALKQ